MASATMGVTTETFSYAESGREHDVYLAYAASATPRPAVLVCPMWAGREGFVESKVRALAELGYVGAGIDLYGVGRRGHDRDSSAALMGELVRDPPMLRRKLRAAFEAVAGRPEVNAAKMAITGYCFGGLCALLAARMGLDLRATVSFHGLLRIGEALETRPQGRLLVLHGQDDPMVSIEDLAAFAAEMKRIDADWQLHCYPRVLHAFTNPKADDRDFGTVYDADADRRSWATMRSFLADCLA